VTTEGWREEGRRERESRGGRVREEEWENEDMTTPTFPILPQNLREPSLPPEFNHPLVMISLSRVNSLAHHQRLKVLCPETRLTWSARPSIATWQTKRLQ
jgi:hypothetical protein